jgi:hypothetical protein
MHPTRPRICFFIGPMRDMKRLHTIAHTIIEPVVARYGYQLVMPGLSGGNIMDFIISKLDTAELLIADLTGNNPNVLYELGIRHCLGTPYVCIKEAGDTAAPFDIAAFEYILFDPADPLGAQRDIEPAVALQHQKLVNEQDISNPVTLFYRAPLTEVSPAAGLALGYYRNLVYQSLDQIRDDRNYIKVNEREITSDERERLTFEVVIPNRLAQATHKYINDFPLYQGKLVKARIEKPPRDITLYARPEEGGALRLVDIPTTMNVMEETIKARITQLRPDKESDEWRTLERQEIERFQSALRRLLRNENDQLVRLKVKVLDWDLGD